jgi:hypothetical protein
MKLPTMGITCDLKDYCFSCVVESTPRDSAGKNMGYHCKICKIDILCPAGVGRQYDKNTGEIIAVCPKCRTKLEKDSYSLNTKIKKGYISFPEDTTLNSPLEMNAVIEVPDWVLWAKPGDIAEINAKISPCIGNKQLNCLVVILDCKSFFAEDSKLKEAADSDPEDALISPPLQMNVSLEVSDWIFWARPGDIADVKAKVSPTINNKELDCLVVVLGSKSCFSR